MRVTSKGQVTIPKHVRDRAGLKPGAEVDFVEQNGQVVVRKAQKSRTRPPTPAEDLARHLDHLRGTVDLGMTVDEYMELVRGE